MIKIDRNLDIKDLTTFGVSAICSFFTEVSSIDELKEAIDYSKKEKLKLLFLGGGSNILFIEQFNGLVVKLNLTGITEEEKDESYVYVTAKAGEQWHAFVQYCINKNYGGLENLSLIPGNVGTSPMQNIGAYGVEIKDHFYKLEALNIKTGEIKEFTCEMCNFGYRESFFKNEGKGNYVILDVTFKLSKKDHQLILSYGSIQEELDKKKIKYPTLKDISQIITDIRKSKLPNPNNIGNAGSFFKNPVIPLEHFETLNKKFPNIPYYKVSDNQVKIPAGWLIEASGWKGKKIDKVGVHERQALVLVNYGGGTGQDILTLSNSIIKSVNEIFSIQIKPEVNIII